MKMFARAILMSILTTTSVSMAQTQITKPEEMAQCLEDYIQQRITSPEEVKWEHAPHYEFAGKYLSASWQTYPLMNFGSIFAFMGPNNVVYCDYQKTPNGVPLWDAGFCKANVESGNIEVEYTKYDAQNNQVKTMRNIGYVQDSKLFCF